MSLEPEHEARRSEIEQSWTDQQRMDRYEGHSVAYLVQHFADLIERDEKRRIYIVERNRAMRAKKKGERQLGRIK